MAKEQTLSSGLLPMGLSHPVVETIRRLAKLTDDRIPLFTAGRITVNVISATNIDVEVDSCEQLRITSRSQASFILLSPAFIRRPNEA